MTFLVVLKAFRLMTEIISKDYIDSRHFTLKGGYASPCTEVGVGCPDVVGW